MRNYWIVPGSMANWKQALVSKGIWGLEDTQLDKSYWLAIAPYDVVLFYVTGNVKGVVGYGIVRSKFYQDVPLWPAEIEEGRVKWPLRFEFDVEFILPEPEWKEKQVRIQRGGVFRQPLILKGWQEIKEIILSLNPNAPLNFLQSSTQLIEEPQAEVLSSEHEGIKEILVQIGKFQGFVTEKEFPMGKERLDAVWRRLPESVPTYVFEVQVGGDLYHALGKLKHAHDIWNSRIFLVASANDRSKANQLLSGTFHEIQTFLKFIAVDKLHLLYKSKRSTLEFEQELGLFP